LRSISIASPHAAVRVHDLPGDGIPLVFLHGLGCASSCDYPRTVRDPALSSRRAVLVDLLGSGFSDRPLDFDYSVQAHARIVVAIIDALGLPVECVELELGDTGRVPTGEGTGSARSLMLAGNAVAEAGTRAREQARAVAADLLEAALDDIVLGDDGHFTVAGTPAKAVTWRDVVDARTIEVAVDFEQPGPTFPSGAHAAAVEVDPETGAVRVVRFVAVDDCGRIVNPMVVEGQQHGGIAQGIAQALFEHVAHDSAGNPLTATFAEYGIPSAAELPSIDAHTIETPSPVNPLGAKGIGQAGAIGSTPAVQNAVVDAVAHIGVRHIDLPLTPERVWRALRR